MSLVINYNSMAAKTATALSNSYGALNTSTRRLSSGLRIGNAADDAAGLAVRELMRSDIAALNQGVRNANDAISMVQTADGALGIIDEKLIRMKELAEQAATGTYDSTQRLMIESEYQAMASEITRIANATDFAGINLLNGALSGAHNGKGLSSEGKLRIHFGTGNDSAEDYYEVEIASVTASSLGVGTQARVGGEMRAGSTVSTQSAAAYALMGVENAIVSKDKIRASLGAMQNRLESTVSNLKLQADNLSSAESRISDVDVSLEMTQFVRSQILTQSAVSMLAQANNMPRMALSLIGG